MTDLVALLAEPNRRRLIGLLARGERSAGELASEFGVTRSAISQHLGALAAAGLVTARKEGRFRYYQLAPEGVAALRAALDAFWTTELKALTAVRPPIPSTTQGARTMPVEKSVVVPLDAESTFALLTEPERLRRWHTVAARIDLRAGGEFRWTVVPGHSAAGVVQHVEPGRRLVLSWGWEGDDALPPGVSTVTITLEPTEGGTLVRLVHEGLTDEQATGHLSGWIHYLDRLVTLAADGDAGPDDWAATPEPMDALNAVEASLAVCQRVLRGVDAGEMRNATPCAKFAVDDLTEHLMGSIVSLGALAGAPAGDLSSDMGAPVERRVADAAQRTIEQWRRRGVDGTVPFGRTDMPASAAASIIAMELLVHAWDFARATNQPLEVSDALAAHVLDMSHRIIRPEIRDGDRFGPEVRTGADAGPLDRLVAFTGRTP